MYEREYTPERITELKPNEIFVFGSNLAGAHGGGAARLAFNRFGAIWGQGVGLQGQSYAIPTMQGGVETIKPFVDKFIRFAKQHPEQKFLVTKIGCGIAGFTVDEIAPLFYEAIYCKNVILPKEFDDIIVRFIDYSIDRFMTRNEFQNYIGKYATVIEEIKLSAHQLHEYVNQTYDKVHPYGYHLDMVAASVHKYGHEVCVAEQDVLPLFFGAYYHDSMEDARQTYNDVMRTARKWMNGEQALTATEIVYALTNDKGRTRAERAGEKYYQGIRETPYAPFVKLADRLANITYSFTHSNEANAHMKDVYQKELPHFLEAITVHSYNDQRFNLPTTMIADLKDIAKQNQ